VDPLAGVTPGNASPFLTTAATVNQTLEAVRRWRRVERGSSGGPSEAPQIVPAVTVWVKNDTGSALPIRSVVALRDPVISPVTYPIDAQRQPVFLGAVPAAAGDAFAVTEEPAEASGAANLVRAVVAGVAVCDLVVNDAAHGYAVPAAGDVTALGSAAYGPAKIVWKEGDTGTVRAVVLLQGSDGCCESGGGTPPGDGCSPSVRLPCWSDSDGDGSADPAPGGDGNIPCVTPIASGAVYYDCSGGDGGNVDGGAIVACDGVPAVVLPQTFTVSATNGTRALIPVGTVTANAARSGAVWPISMQVGKFRLQGELVFCCTADPKGLYFSGSVYTSYEDPDEDADAANLWCGCMRSFSACPPCNQEIVSGPSYGPLAQTLRLDLGCGTIDLVIGPCTTIAGWDGPGYYCVEECTPIVGWAGPGYYCVRDSGEGS